MYDEDDIKIYESSAGFNSILEGNINNLEIINRNNIKELWISLSTGISIFNIDKIDLKTTNSIKEVQEINFLNGFSSILII